MESSLCAKTTRLANSGDTLTQLDPSKIKYLEWIIFVNTTGLRIICNA